MSDSGDLMMDLDWCQVGRSQRLAAGAGPAGPPRRVQSPVLCR